MTLVQTCARSTPTVPAGAADRTASAGPRVWDAMTVEVALSLMAAADTGHLVICDDDGQRTGCVALDRLTDVRDSPGYTDRVRLRDLADTAGHCAPPELLVVPG
ncbi:hypothetical protein SAMN06297387_104314 [Streptomyces zhaozhouensis]|uniref:CBS domain-containing protein n=1 Tax=Streptomyces zhaozhouensis TaxID=1300267 RepID=A0A286DU97_9ACTN|nr:hypothetical protein [Streptomyces zhaozhouensis]SOD62144.1 hypothetical protein SAMN06297387_104314 [Streptomyces zhaozhouensis]